MAPISPFFAALGRLRTARLLLLPLVVVLIAPWCRPTPASAAEIAHVGVLNPTPQTATSLAASGITTVNLQLGWDAAQPSAGGLNPYYLAEVRSAYTTYRTAGLRVVLDPGLQYPPEWVVALPNSRFVNQYGESFTATTASGENVVDGVWNPRVRDAQSRYLAALGSALGKRSFAAVRVGGLLTGELRYPRANEGGRVDAWWAFGPLAQASSPVPGYRPGQAGRTAARDAAFVGYYLDSLVGYQDFLVKSTRAAFDGDLMLMYPSFGVRPGDQDGLVRSGLATTAVRYSEVVQGVDFARLVSRYPAYLKAGYGRTGRLIAYTTWLDGPQYSTEPTGLSPIGYLAHLAGPVSMPLGGENTASTASSTEALALSQQRARSLRLVALFWFNEPEPRENTLLSQLARTFQGSPSGGKVGRLTSAGLSAGRASPP